MQKGFMRVYKMCEQEFWEIFTTSGFMYIVCFAFLCTFAGLFYFS